METTPTGLIVPDGTVERVKVDVFWDPWETEQFQHASETLIRKGLAFIVVCKACAEEKRNFQVSILPDENGKPVGECDCTRIHFRMRRKKGRR